MGWERVEQVLTELPGVEGGTSYGTRAFRVRGRLVARQREEDGAAVVRVDPAERPALLADESGAYFVTAHYEDHPTWVLVDLEVVDPDELSELLTQAWRLVAPGTLISGHDDIYEA